MEGEGEGEVWAAPRLVKSQRWLTVVLRLEKTVSLGIHWKLPHMPPHIPACSSPSATAKTKGVQTPSPTASGNLVVDLLAWLAARTTPIGIRVEGRYGSTAKVVFVVPDE